MKNAKHISVQDVLLARIVNKLKFLILKSKIPVFWNPIFFFKSKIVSLIIAILYHLAPSSLFRGNSVSFSSKINF